MPQKGKYFVHFPEDDPVLTYGGYTLRSAISFARIGSQTGGDRIVTRGKKGPVIRVYRKGERWWPISKAQLTHLRGDERLTRREEPKGLK